MEGEEDADPGSKDDALATCYAAWVQGRIVFGPAAGWHVCRIVDPARVTAIYRPGELCECS